MTALFRCLAGVFAAHQCLTALAVGADYMAPYLGRMDDAGKDVRACAVLAHPMPQP